MFPTVCATYHETPAARQLREDVIAALHDAQLARKETALLMGIPESTLSRQLSGEPGTHLSAWRLTALPESFWTALLARRAARGGCVLLTPDLVTLLRGAAAIGLKRMAKFTLPSEKAKAS